MMKKIILILIFSLILPVFAGEDKIEVIKNTPGIYMFKIDYKKYGDKIKPYMTHTLTTPRKVYEDKSFDLVVNGGFFDVNNGKSVSRVIIDNETVADIVDDTILVESLKNENRYENVLNRSEFRILENNNGKLKFDIALRDEKLPNGYHIKHALQAGPIIYPDMDLSKEGFVIYDNDEVVFQSVDILKRRERTIVALKGKYLYIVLFTKDNKADAIDINKFCKEMKFDKAMAFDGGLSTAINTKGYDIGSLGKYQRKVKSFLIIER